MTTESIVLRSYAPITVAGGTAVRFNWAKRHGLYQIPSGQCPASFTPGNGIVALAKASNGGSFTTPGLAPGVYWFACPVRARLLSFFRVLGRLLI